MTPARWQQVRETLASALEQRTIPERSLFLFQVCADDTALRREVESLLNQSPGPFDARAESGGFLQGRLMQPNEGRRVGAYRLVRELGRGGMGAVWLAERADQRFEQQVAIKLLKRGTDTEEVLRRFRAERQILARLDHPGIARLFDGGETDDGLPFFVMEYVAGGECLTTFARQQALSFNGRLQLFQKVCAAIQFAHQHLVVHRDLKPGNILVTPEGEPKLLDFGIARLLEPGEGGTTTAVDSRRLTPAYASPEQAQGGPITTATDIYSLGALLYELLTEQSPYKFSSDRPSPAELLRVVAEQDPRRPSLVAMSRDSRRRLRGDLDNIILRALAREPARRYANASGLADDLQRHLSGRPVRARPNTMSYGARKFIGRNKVAVAAGGLLAIALAGGVTATVWEARRATRRFGEVRRLTNSVLFEIHDAIRDLPGSTSARQLIVNRALEYLDRLARESRGEKALQLELADAYLKVGDVQGKPYTANLGDLTGALHSYTKAADIAVPLAASERGASSIARATLSQAYESLGAVQSRLHRSEEAASSHNRALALREGLLKSDPAHFEQWERGIVANYLGLGDAVVSANRIKPSTGYQHGALEIYRRALPLCEKLVAAHPDSSADSLLLAKACARIAIELSELGAAEHDAGAFQEALDLHLRTLALEETALRNDPASVPVRRTLADELIALGYLRALSGENLDQGLNECRRAREIIENQAMSDPANTEARQDLSSLHFVMARLLQAKGDFTAAADSYRLSLKILEPLVAEHPENVETAFDLVRVHDGLRAVSVPQQP
jgi:tRNA A-37 threonylcarbamoyl transferase component Bud32/tetratricopeptide (TPR) repeat protein